MSLIHNKSGRMYVTNFSEALYHYPLPFCDDLPKFSIMVIEVFSLIMINLKFVAILMLITIFIDSNLLLSDRNKQNSQDRSMYLMVRQLVVDFKI